MDAFSGLLEPRRFFASVHRIVFVIPVSSVFSFLSPLEIQPPLKLFYTSTAFRQNHP